MSIHDSELLGNTGIRWSTESIYKAEKLIEDNLVQRDAEHPDVFWVQGSERYRVQTDGKEFITCTCPNGERRSRPNCYHTAAALLVLQDSPDDLMAVAEAVGVAKERGQVIHYIGENAGEACTSAYVQWHDDDETQGICFDHDRRVRRA